MIYGYARVPADGQSVNAQIAQLEQDASERTPRQ